MAHPGTSGAAERGQERAKRDVVEGDGDLGEAGPWVTPPAGEEAATHGGGDGSEAFEDLKKQVVR
jgi:hypothetical protein